MVDYALELVNNRTDILANYTLKHNNVLDSGVSEEVLFRKSWAFLSTLSDIIGLIMLMHAGRIQNAGSQ